MKLKKILAAFVTATMALSLVACGGTEKEEAVKNEENSEEAANIKITFPILSTVPEDLEMVQEKMSEISLEKCNCTVTLQPMGMAEYNSQAPLMLSGNEDIGLMIHFDPITNYSTLVSKGQVQDITNLIEEKAPEILDVVGEEYLNACRIDGKLYGVPTMHGMATGYGVVMRTDLLEKYNIDVSEIKTLEDMEPVFRTILENENEIAPFFTGGSAIQPADALMKATADTLGDGYGVLMNYGQDKTVTDYFESDEYTNYVKTLYDWNQKGYILADSDSTQDTYLTLLKAGKIFASCMTTQPGQLQQDERNTGMDLTYVNLTKANSMTSLVNGLQWVVPTGATNPEKSVEILNLLYTDADFLNLLNYGIEGKHYVLNDDGQMELPEGVTEETRTFNWSIAYETGNEYICHTWATDDIDFWDQVKIYNDEAVKSSAMGFTFDNSNVSTELTALANVASQYRVGLENGALDPDKYLDKFISAMKEAGLDTVIEEKQKQLDEWRNNQ